jgi:Flp pilus assembly protein TadG
MSCLPRFRMATRTWRSRKGVASVELGMVLPVMLLVFTAIGSYGSVMWAKMQVESAARAGATYAATHGLDNAGITSAISSATGLTGITASPAPQQICSCADVKLGLSPVACDASCPGNTDPGRYVVVHARVIFSPLISFSGLGKSVTLTSTAATRTP